MHPVFSRNLFLVKEHVGMFKASNNYDILDPESGEVILECREPNLGMITKLLRFTDFKRSTPFDVHISEPGQAPLLRVARGISIFLSQVEVLDEEDRVLGGFKQKFLSVGGKFQLEDSSGNPLCMLKGKWTGWDFRFIDDNDREFAHVTKKWAGLGKEMFTTADTYMLEISERVPADNPLRALILGSVMVIDMVLKE